MMLSVALAAPVERLHAAAALVQDAPVHTGVMHHLGHGPVPGHGSDHAFVATIDGPFAQWAGDGWTETGWLDRTAWSYQDDTWAPAGDALAIQLLAANPGRLLTYMAQHPARLAEVDGDVLWSTPDGLWRLAFTDGRPARLTCARSHPVFGDVVDEVRWSHRPLRVDVSMVDADTRWTATLTPSLALAAAKAPPPPVRVTAVALGETTWALQVPEANGRSLMTVWGHEGVVFDAPLSSELGAAQLAEARRLAPQVTDWSVVVSHHHPHYTGGLRPWARAGATIVVPAAILDTVRGQLTEARLLDPSDPAAPTPRLLAVSSDLSLLQGKVLVNPIDAASGHTDGFLMSLVVPDQLLYVADLASRRTGEERAQHRGAWPESLQPWTPEVVVSGWPLTGTDDQWPFSSL